MERVHQMNVVPDLLGELHPSFDLRVNFPERLSDEIRMRNRTKAKVEKMEPGVFLLPEQVYQPTALAESTFNLAQTRKPPALYTTVFHAEPRLYTMLMVDLGLLLCVDDIELLTWAFRRPKSGTSRVPIVPPLDAVSFFLFCNSPVPTPVH